MTNYTLPIAIVHLLFFLSLVNTSLIDNAAHIISTQPQSAETSILAHLKALSPTHHELETGTVKRDEYDYDYTNFTALQGTWSGNERFFGGLINETHMICNDTMNTCSIDWYVDGSSLIWVENCDGEIEITEGVLLEFWYGVVVKFWYAGAIFCFTWQETSTGSVVFMDFRDPLGSCSGYTAPMCSETHFVVLFTLNKVSSTPTPPPNVTIPNGYPASLAPVQGFWTGTLDPYSHDRSRGCLKQQSIQVAISISGDDIVLLINNAAEGITFVVWGWIIDFQGSQLIWHSESEINNMPICFAWEQNGTKVQAAWVWESLNRDVCPSSTNPICGEYDYSIMNLECVTNCASPSVPTPSPPPSANALQLAQGVWSGTVTGFPESRDCGTQLSCEATLIISGRIVNFTQYCRSWVPPNLYTMSGTLNQIEGNVMWWTANTSRQGLIVPICTVWKQDGRNLVAATDFENAMTCPSQTVPLCDYDSYVLVYTLECKSGCAPEPKPEPAPVHGPKGLSSGAKVGIVIAVIAFVVIFAVIGVMAFTAYRKRESASPSDYLAMPDDDDKM